MDVHERMLSLAGRDVLFRPIEFERYRKPHVVEYPRHATVLNPQHTRLQQQQQQQQTNGRVGDDAAHDSSDDDDGDKTSKRRRKGAEDDAQSADDDDPRYMPASDYLCSDQTLEKVMHLRWKEVGPVGVGLVNLGNTCFANSVLQAFSYTPALAQFFAETYRTADAQLGAPYDFAYALGETIRQVHLGRATGGASQRQGHRGAYRPGMIVGHLRTLSSHFSLGKQSDAHEFAVQLLFACQKSILYRLVGSKKLPLRVTQTTALARINGGYVRSQVRWSRQDEIQQLLKAGKRQEAADLKMELRNKQGTRNGDRMTSNTYDPTNILHVELAGHTLEHCLAKFCEAEKLHGRCYHSPRDVPVIATKQLKVHMAPNVLILHLKRFTPTGGKVSKYVQYPVTLNLYPYTTEYERATMEGDGSATNGAHKEHPEYMYELNAVCVHEGNSINYGHYYAVVRARNGTWYECNDDAVSPLSQDKALRQQAYVLFYSRVPSERRRSAAVHKTTRGEGLRAPGERHGSAVGPWPGTSRAVADANATGFEVGRELTEEEVAALLRQRKKASPKSSPHLAPQSASSASEKPKVTKNKYTSQQEDMRRTFKRRRDDLSTDEDEDEAEGDHGAADNPISSDEEEPRHTNRRPSHQAATTSTTHASRRPSSFLASSSVATDGPTSGGVEASSHGGQTGEHAAKRSVRHSMYGGVVKAMRVNPATPLQRALKARNGAGGGASDASTPKSLPNDPKGRAVETRALGRAAVIALEEKKHQAVPETVKRDATAPKFQQRIRDAMWEMEMDKGRVKKVKRKKNDDGTLHGDGERVNRFQERSRNRFDIRGRRIQEDAGDGHAE